MKKIISVLIVLVLFTGAVFAQTADGISVQGWGRGVFAPLQFVTAPQTDGKVEKDAAGKDKEGTAYAGSGVTWGGSEARVDFRVNANSDFVGFNTQNGIESGVGNLEMGASLWAKPFGSDIAKLTVGKFVDDSLRGRIGDFNGGFAAFVLVEGFEDAIFQRFGVGNEQSTNLPSSNGFMISSSPMDGLYIGMLLSGNLFKGWGGAGSGDFAANVYRYLQVGAGYWIEGIGQIRAQYIGGWFGSLDPTSADDMKYFDSPFNASGGIDLDKDGNPIWKDYSKRAKIQLAFCLTAVENLFVDMGVTIGLPLELSVSGNGIKSTSGINFAMGASYNMDMISIGFGMGIFGLGSYDRGIGSGIDDKSLNSVYTDFHLAPAFNLDFATIGLDFGLKLKGKSALYNGDKVDDDGSQIGFGVFIQKGLGKGSAKAGVAYKLPWNDKDGAQGSGVLSIPIILEYAFF